MNDNKKIAVNTIVIYLRLVITTIIGLFTSRYVLLALGQSDFGLYSVVGSIIAFINIVGIAMYTTTRRYINIEMGKGDKGNPNKIFNVSLLVHVGFAFLFLLIAETLGVWYIDNYLNVDPNKIGDAHFVFQISLIVACLNLINVPYQSLLNAFQKFSQIAIIDIVSALLKITFVILMVYYDGNVLRFYAIGMSLMTLASFMFYHIACAIQWKEIIRYRFYWDKPLYKEILVFNNYTVLGAISCLGRTQGTTMVVNYFFGTMVNGALAIAYAIQSYTQTFAGNIAQAAAPQITQAYSGDNLQRAYNLASKVARITILIMICIVVPLYCCIDEILVLWLKKVPEGAPLLCQWTLIIALFSSFNSNLSTYVQATGKIKWFQIIGSIVEISVLPISFALFCIGFPPVTILIVLVVITLVNLILSLILLNRLNKFPSKKYAIETFTRPFIIVAIIYVLQLFCLSDIEIMGHEMLFVGAAAFIFALILSWSIGLKHSEKTLIYSYIRNRL